MLISLFNDITNAKDVKHVEASYIIDCIRNGKWKANIEQLNSFDYDSHEQKEYKKGLNVILWQGTFSARRNDAILQHSGLVAIDFDKIPEDKMAEYYQKLSGDPITFALFRSPRLNGYKCIVRIPEDVNEHKNHVMALKTHYMSPYYDHFQDIARACFVSYDPNLYYNPDAIPFTKKEYEKVEVRQTNDSIAVNSKSIIQKLIKWCEQTEQCYYVDGNKHTYLIKLFSACSRYGVNLYDSIDFVYDYCSKIQGVGQVPFSDFEFTATDVYKRYSSIFNTAKFEDSTDNNGNPLYAHDYTDPVSYFNANHSGMAKYILKKKGWKILSSNGVEKWQQPDLTDDSISALWNFKLNALQITVDTIKEFKKDCYYTPFQIITILMWNNNYITALHWVIRHYNLETDNYIRVGTDYFKIIKKTDRFNLKRTELKAWKKDEIKQDEGKDYPCNIPKYDDFTIAPNNIDYQPVVSNCYNLYKPFEHEPKEGDHCWSDTILKHIFGEQLNLGLRYLQALYLHPERMLPILVLVSKERQTGKTTFINWLNMMFGANMVNINPEDLVNSFNASYATANIIAVEETLIEKSVTVEKLKALATGKFINVNQKFISQYKVPFYGKIILASNNEDKFARIDEEEIRFFVRKVGKPTIYNHDIENNLLSEIPAFLHYLTTLPQIDWSKDRSGFTPDELINDSLQNVKKESKSTLYKEIKEYFTDLFNNIDQDIIYATPIDIKEKWFDKNHKASVSYIRSVLKEEFHMTPEPNQRYVPMGKIAEFNPITKTGTPYLFKREDYTNSQSLHLNYENQPLPF